VNPGGDRLGAAAGDPFQRGGAVGALERALAAINRLTLFVGMIALLMASFVLTYSVFSRYWFKAATDWQDEVAVFCIVGAVFLCGAWVQAQRGHVGIEAIAGLLSPRINRIRMALVDLMSLAFCAFFAWKSWTLFHEAWIDKMTTSSTFAPPLTIPYGLMAAGMSLLVLQLLLQSAVRLAGPRPSE
jgi:TRAP-type C4-dicarboxylate transport system permease small subunit